MENVFVRNFVVTANVTAKTNLTKKAAEKKVIIMLRILEICVPLKAVQRRAVNIIFVTTGVG